MNFLQFITEDDYLKLRIQNEKLKVIRSHFKKFFSDKRE